MNVLAIGAHFDDLELGCGGALARHCRNGDKVIGFIATDSGFYDTQGAQLRVSETALQEAMEASQIIGYDLVVGGIPTFGLEYGEQIHCKLIKLIEENDIEMIYTHWIHDVHHDHRNLALATLHSSRHVNRLLMYRSNWYPSEREFCGNFYIDITETWAIKEEAVRAYHSEMQRIGETWLTYFKNDAENNGLKTGTKYAEVFQTVKWLI